MAEEALAGQAQACLIRVARLDADGLPDPGAGNLYVSEGLVSLQWQPDVATGDELEKVNGCGDSAVYLRADDRVKKLNLTVNLVAPEPELLEMLAGGTVHALVGDTVGYGHPGTGRVGGASDVSIELWEAVIVDGSIVGHARHVWPRTRGWRQTGATHENDVLDVQLTGWAFNNAGWGDGPAYDWATLSDDPVLLYDWALETGDLPTATGGAVVLPAAPPPP